MTAPNFVLQMNFCFRPAECILSTDVALCRFYCLLSKRDIELNTYP